MCCRYCHMGLVMPSTSSTLLNFFLSPPLILLYVGCLRSDMSFTFLGSRAPATIVRRALSLPFSLLILPHTVAIRFAVHFCGLPLHSRFC